MSSAHVWQDFSVGLIDFYYLLTSLFFRFYLPLFSHLSFYLSNDPGDLGGGPGCGLAGPELRAPG